MLSALKYVLGAVSRKDYAEEMCHLLIKDGWVVAYDGLLSMASTIPIGLHVKPHARTLMKAIKACDDKATISLHVTPANKLAVKSGKFKAYVDCLADERDMALPLPQGDWVTITDELFAAIKMLAPVMSIDPSRAWSSGIRIATNTAHATNNVIIAERWHGANFPYDFILPADAVNEMLRVGETPTGVQVCESSVTFWYGETKWLRTQLVADKWPSRAAELFNVPSTPVAIPEGFYAALKKLKTFTGEGSRIYFSEGRLSTERTEGTGAAVELDIPDFNNAVFNIDQLMLLQDLATKIDFVAFPKPCPFFGDKLRGMIVGFVS